MEEAGSVARDPVRMKLIKYRSNPINEIQEMVALDLETKIETSRFMKKKT